MKNAELKNAIAKYIKSKELILMGYSPEYIEDVKTDMEIAFRAGAEWMAGQGETHELTVKSPVLGPPMICCPVHADNGDKVIVQIRKDDIAI